MVVLGGGAVSYERGTPVGLTVQGVGTGVLGVLGERGGDVGGVPSPSQSTSVPAPVDL